MFKKKTTRIKIMIDPTNKLLKNTNEPLDDQFMMTNTHQYSAEHRISC